MLIIRMSLAFLMTGLSSISIIQAQPGQQENAPSSQKVIRKSTGVLQKDAIERVEPDYPALALAAKASGSVVVEVRVDEQGNVMAARAISGHPLLKDAAVRAAMKWRFKPTKLSGEAVQVIGNIVFDFAIKGEKRGNRIEEPEDKSIAALEKRARENPNSDEVHLDLGVAYTESGRYVEAIRELKEAVRLKPESPYAHYKLGVAYIRSDRYEEAAESYARAVKIDPDGWNNDAAYFGLGLVNLQLGRYEEAIKALKECTRLAPAAADGHMALAVAHSMLGEYKEAIPPLKRVLEINPENANGRYWLGRAYLQLGDKPSALKEYEALKQLDRERAEQLLREINDK